MSSRPFFFTTAHMLIAVVVQWLSSRPMSMFTGEGKLSISEAQKTSSHGDTCQSRRSRWNAKRSSSIAINLRVISDSYLFVA